MYFFLFFLLTVLTYPLFPSDAFNRLVESPPPVSCSHPCPSVCFRKARLFHELFLLVFFYSHCLLSPFLSVRLSVPMSFLSYSIIMVFLPFVLSFVFAVKMLLVRHFIYFLYLSIYIFFFIQWQDFLPLRLPSGYYCLCFSTLFLLDGSNYL